MQAAPELARFVAKGEHAAAILLDQLDRITIVEKAHDVAVRLDPLGILAAEEFDHLGAPRGDPIALRERDFDVIFFAARFHARGPVHHRAGLAVAAKAGGEQRARVNHHAGDVDQFAALLQAADKSAPGLLFVIAQPIE